MRHTPSVPWICKDKTRTTETIVSPWGLILPKAISKCQRMKLTDLQQAEPRDKDKQSAVDMTSGSGYPEASWSQYFSVPLGFSHSNVYTKSPDPLTLSEKLRTLEAGQQQSPSGLSLPSWIPARDKSLLCDKKRWLFCVSITGFHSYHLGSPQYLWLP